MLSLFQQIIDQFRHQLANNEFLVGMLTTTMLGAGAYLLRSVPHRISRFIFRLITIEVTFRSDDAAFAMASEYVLKRMLVESLARVFLLVFYDDMGELTSLPSNFVRHPRHSTKNKLANESRHFQVGYGRHLGWYHGRFVTIHRDVEKEATTDRFKETIRLVFFSRNRQILEDFVASTRLYIEETTNAGKLWVYTSAGDWWSKHTQVPSRSLDSVFIPQEAKQRVIEHLDSFFDSEEDCMRRGVPYHTGLFLYGLPGTGKSSLIHAIASHYKRSIRYLNLAAVEGDAGFMALLGQGWGDSILVVEDIDVTHAVEDMETKPKKRGDVSMASLLNSLDGLLTPHGMIVIATANKLEALAPAMLREGRFDLQIEFGLMQWLEFEEMALAFGHAAGVVDSMQADYLPMVPVEARNMLLRKRGGQSNSASNILSYDGEAAGCGSDPVREDGALAA